jgi:hypothetical protein
MGVFFPGFAKKDHGRRRILLEVTADTPPPLNPAPSEGAGSS